MDGASQPIQSEIYSLAAQLREIEGDGTLIDCLTTIHGYLELFTGEPKNSTYRSKLLECFGWLDRISRAQTRAAEILRESNLQRELFQLPLWH